MYIHVHVCRQLRYVYDHNCVFILIQCTAGSRISKVLASTGQEQAVVAVATGAEPQVGGAESSPRRSAAIEESKDKEAETTPKKKSRRSQQPANRGLYVSPGLRFIVRKDLYSFLTSAGVSDHSHTQCHACVHALYYSSWLAKPS